MATPTTKPEAKDEALSFSELLPTSQRTTYPHINTVDGQTVEIKDVGQENNDKDAKSGWFVTLSDDRKFGVPTTTAKKLISALVNAANAKKGGKGNGNIKAKVQKLERGVRLA